ncbi:diacylglycerol/lipid kinase family protein [Cryptosporangium aurantiacum]|nr:diacylglycerol kinase family protein [Cryptosporangium aurantiacum]
MASATAPVPRRIRWVQRGLARSAFLAAAACLVLPLTVAGLRSISLLALGVGGAALTLAAGWWFLSHRGVRRWIAGAVVLAVPCAVAAWYIRAELLWAVIVTAFLWGLALGLGRAALAEFPRPAPPTEYETPTPRHPYVIMNPRSGGGKVDRFGLADAARARGAEVVLLDDDHKDAASLARQAVYAGADLLGVAGGDGTQALVADVAAETGVPFMVISAGTRNHFALDLGLDRDHPETCLDALTDGVEVRIDLGRVGGRTFVNNASFGAYATIVDRPTYRGKKAGTALDVLPDLLAEHSGPALRVTVGQTVLNGPVAALVSNNPYRVDDVAHFGQRPRLDGGVLGVLAVVMHGAMDASRILRGRRSRSLRVVQGREVVVDADVASIPVGIDGESFWLHTPVRCTIRPRALRVRVPRNRPGVRPPRPTMDWRRLGRIALSTGSRTVDA